jgi:lysophospholipase L1-like esterase
MTCCIRSLLFVLVLVGVWGPVSAQTCDETAVMQTTQPRARPDFQADRQAIFVKWLASGSYGAIALGDSILAGWQPRRLQAEFGQPTLSIPFGGDGTETVLWRLHTFDWSHQHPLYVLLLIGTNDIRFPACAVAQGILTVVHQAHATFPQATVVVTSILPRGVDLREYDSKIVEVNRTLAAAARPERFRFLDAHDAFLCDHHNECPLYLPGNLHLTQAGYQLLTDLLHRLLQSG